MSDSMYPQYASRPPTNNLAIVSLIAGILSWFVFPFFGAVIAIIAGHVARQQIKDSCDAEGGDGLAIIGLILGYLHLLGACVGFLIFLLAFGGTVGLGGCAILSGAGSVDISSIAIPPISLNLGLKQLGLKTFLEAGFKPDKLA